MMRLLPNRFATLSRRVLGGLLALSIAWLSGSNVALAAKSAPTGFTDGQMAQITKARGQMMAAQSRLGELQDYINAEDWTYTSNFIHGPLGDLRREAATISRNLPTKDQKQSRKQAKSLMRHVENLDMAAKDDSARLVQKEYVGLVDDLAAFLDLVPAFESDS